MDGEKLVNGKKLVELLDSSDAIPAQSSIMLPEKVNGYIRQAYCFFYGDGIDTGIVLLDRKAKPKKDEPVEYHSLAAVNLSEAITNYLNNVKSKAESPDYGDIAKRAIDDVIKQSVGGIPFLLTHEYIIAEGDIATMIYHSVNSSLGINSPKAKELASIIKQYERKPVPTHPTNPQTLFPDQQTRISLGRGV